MSALAVVVAALALAGAHPGSTIICDPSVTDAANAEGIAMIGLKEAWVGIDGCRALLAGGLSRQSYAAVERINRIQLARTAGPGLLIVLHEARHLEGEMNECQAEKFARLHVDTLIHRFIPQPEQALALSAALDLDKRFEPLYHGC